MSEEGTDKEIEEILTDLDDILGDLSGPGKPSSSAPADPAAPVVAPPPGMPKVPVSQVQPPENKPALSTPPIRPTAPAPKPAPTTQAAPVSLPLAGQGEVRGEGGGNVPQVPVPQVPPKPVPAAQVPPKPAPVPQVPPKLPSAGPSAEGPSRKEDEQRDGHAAPSSASGTARAEADKRAAAPAAQVPPKPAPVPQVPPKPVPAAQVPPKPAPVPQVPPKLPSAGPSAAGTARAEADKRAAVPAAQVPPKPVPMSPPAWTSVPKTPSAPQIPPNQTPPDPALQPVSEQAASLPSPPKMYGSPEDAGEIDLGPRPVMLGPKPVSAGRPAEKKGVPAAKLPLSRPPLELDAAVPAAEPVPTATPVPEGKPSSAVPAPESVPVSAPVPQAAPAPASSSGGPSAAVPAPTPAAAPAAPAPRSVSVPQAAPAAPPEKSAAASSAPPARGAVTGLRVVPIEAPPEDPKTPVAQIRRLAFLFGPGQEARCAEFEKFLRATALKLSKKPLHIRVALFAEVGEGAVPGVLLEAMRAAGAVGAVGVLAGLPEARLQELQDACAKEDFFFRSVPQDQTQKRTLAMDMMLELMLLKAG